MHRRASVAHLSAVLAPLLCVAALAACGDDTTAGTPTTEPPIEHPTGADEVVLRVAQEGGFVPAAVNFTNLPTLVISGDGEVFTQAPIPEIYPGPLMSPFTTRSITEQGVQAVLRRAAAGGLLAEPRDYSDQPNVTDMPDTVVTITAEGTTFEHRAYALGFEDETSPARRDLAAFVAAVGDLATLAGADQLGEEIPFVPAAVRLQATPVERSAIGSGDVEPTFVDWPADTDVTLAGAATCAITSDPEAIAALVEARQTTYFVEAGTTHAVAAAPVIPGDHGC